MAEESMQSRTEYASLDRLLDGIDIALRQSVDTQADHLSRRLSLQADQASQADTYILFAIGERRLAVRLADVAEIGDLPPVTRLPNLPDWLLGITNVRGDIVSVMDFARFLGWSVEQKSRQNRMVIIRYNTIKTAIRFNHVTGTHRRTERLEPGARSLGRIDAILPQQLTAGEETYLVLDCRALCSDDRFLGIRP